ncbi:ATP-binding protein [Vibrio vulnificus]|nr:ATP-binding protein [Vibrio vulnificus]EID0716926.1 ATP-binding protein [Vibrio vulnificus]EID0741598.1 ATP-binding protein [Vibrio vulnificus]EJL7818194.1 ATP-binding protein [Vibrio vulnificus]
MRIQELYVRDLWSGIVINDVKFSRLNVLVGVSGAGKTTIISALKTLVRIAEGNLAKGAEWRLTFLDDSQQQITWSGKTSKKMEFTVSGITARIISEKLVVNDETVIDSSENGVFFYNNKLPRLDDTKSLLFHLKNEIRNIHESLTSSVIIDVDSPDFSPTNRQMINKNSYLDEIHEFKKNFDIKKFSHQNRELNCKEKLFYAFEYDKSAFFEFQETYISIFEQVKKIEPKVVRTFETTENNRMMIIELELVNGQRVHQSHISSGMFKTMMILAELHFGSNHSPIIIDEIENSLGVNCLPEILSQLNDTENQVIITSHHPRVINEIPTKFWNIVSRKPDGSVVTYPATQVLPSGRHEAFIQLMNSPEFRGLT